MITRAIAVLAASAALFIIISAVGLPAHAGSSAQPIGASLIEVNGLCLTTVSGPAPSPVWATKCDPSLPGEWWKVRKGGLISLWGSTGRAYLSIERDGFLVLADRGKLPDLWTYGPGHELTVSLPAGQAHLTWVAGHGRQPWADTMAGPGQSVSIFTKTG